MNRFVTHATMNEDLFLDSTCLTCKVVVWRLCIWSETFGAASDCRDGNDINISLITHISNEQYMSQFHETYTRGLSKIMSGKKK